MKRFLLLSFLIFCFSVIYGQSSKELFNSDEMTWFGLDFSRVKLLGSSEFTNLSEIRDYYFDAINDVIVTEKKKYNLSKYLRKEIVDYNLDIVRERNLNVDIEKAVTDDDRFTNFLTENDIENTIKEYDLDSTSGLGVVFIVDNLNKLDGSTESMFVTYFDISTKEVLLTEKMTAKAGGFGFRNYWVSPVYKILKEIYDDKYEEWKDHLSK